jgi:hypothetical protein
MQIPDLPDAAHPLIKNACQASAHATLITILVA